MPEDPDTFGFSQRLQNAADAQRKAHRAEQEASAPTSAAEPAPRARRTFYMSDRHFGQLKAKQHAAGRGDDLGGFLVEALGLEESP